MTEVGRSDALIDEVDHDGKTALDILCSEFRGTKAEMMETKHSLEYP